jgi:hypothetical protein
LLLAWSDAAAKPLDDIVRVIKARSKGVSLKFMMMDQNTFDNMAANDQYVSILFLLKTCGI